MFPLPVDYHPKGPVCQISFDALNVMARMLNAPVVVMASPGTLAHFQPPAQDGQNWTLVIPQGGGGGGAMPFSGIVRMNLLPKITIDTAETGATQFLYMHSDGSHTWAATMPDTQPADGRVFDLTQTAGDIQIMGIFAG